MCDDCRDLAEKNARLGEEISGLLYTTRRQGHEIVSLKAEATKRAKTSTNAAQIECVLVNWMRLCRGRTSHDGKKGRLPVIDADSKRWKLVAKALKSHDVSECLEAVEGLAAMPYVGAYGRAASGLPSQRYDDIEYALKDEGQIEKARKWRAQALGASERALFDAWTAASGTETFYLTAWLNRYQRDEHHRLPGHKQITHTAELERAWAGGADVIDLASRRPAA